MLRILGEFVSLIVFLLIARSVISSVWQLVRGISQQGPLSQGTAERASPEQMHTSGQLRKDPVCGTFVATSTPYSQISDGTTQYFCSKACAELFKTERKTQKWEKSTAPRS